MPFDHRTQELVLPEMIGDLFRVGVQIEKFAHMLDQWKKHRRKRCRHAKTKRVALRQQLDFQPAACFSDLHRTRVSGFENGLHPACGARLQPGQQFAPSQGRPVSEA